jgi:hypothetical protein
MRSVVIRRSGDAILALVLILALASVANGCGPAAPPAPGGRERGRPIRPEVLQPNVVTPRTLTASVAPPRLAQVHVLPVVAHGPRQIDAYRQESATVDILWVVDTQGSMIDKRMRLAAEFDRFLQVLLGANVDFHIGVTSTNLLASGDQGRLRGPVPWIERTTPDPVGSFRAAVTFPDDRTITLAEGLGAVVAALTPPDSSGANAGFIREPAALAAIVVSDGDDESLGPSDFYVRFLRGFKGAGRDVNTSLSAVVGDLPNGCTPAGEERVFGAHADPGTRYVDVAHATGGLVASICTSDFGPFVEALATALTGLRRFFPLSAPPKDGTIVVRVNGVLVPESPTNGWSYAAGQRGITFNGMAVPPPGADVKISYDIAM